MAEEVRWPPKHETYCRECRKIVAARIDLGSLDTPDTHFVFCTVDDYGRRGGPFKVCQGRRGTSALTHGMEDPRAASYVGPEPVDLCL
jgi:hypothetical protein